MKKVFLFFLPLSVLVITSILSCSHKKNTDTSGKSEKSTSINHPAKRTVIAFGSCSKQYNPNQLWLDILENDPDIWIWLGDNIYGDTHDMDLMAEKYAHQKADTGYQLLIKSGTHIIGTWDDHDYGVNDSGRNYARKEESKVGGQDG